MSFSIDVTEYYWINGSGDDPYDYCLHGRAVAHIGDETLEYDATVSAAAMYLLRSLTQDHLIGSDKKMLPCCGNVYYANEATGDVYIDGCPNGIDWEVRRIGDSVCLTTESGTRELVPIEAYRREVFRFADKIEAVYKSCSPKTIDAEHERNGFAAFWREWRRRRYGENKCF